MPTGGDGPRGGVQARRPVPQRLRPYGPVPTFTLRRSRMGAGQADALARLWPCWGLDVDGAPLDLAELFGRTAPVVLEIGSGMGEATAEAAAREPDRDLLAVDVHTPGHGTLLRLAEERGLRNVRVADGDARVLLEAMLAPVTLAEVRVWFPDPWPKTRHAKRRLLTPAFLALVASRLRPGGLLHVATDWQPYAVQVAARLAATPGLEPAATAPDRPVTRVERAARAAGRRSYDLSATASGGGPSSAR